MQTRDDFRVKYELIGDQRRRVYTAKEEEEE